MQTIGEVDESKTMLEQIDDYDVNGYRVRDLNEKDYAIIRAMAYLIDIVEQYDEYDTDEDDRLIERMMNEVAEEVKAGIQMSMLSELGMMLFHMIEGYQDEKGEQG